MSSLQLALGAVRAESGITTRVATGTPENFLVAEETVTEKTAENYFVRARYDRTLAGAFFFFGGAGWDRNTFAGIHNRFGMVAGIGRTWFQDDARRLKTDLGGTYTVQKDLVETPGAQDSFFGARASLDYHRTLSETSSYSSLLVVNESFDDPTDLRADWTNSVAVTMSERLALKASYQLLFDNLPALTSVPLGDGTVTFPLQKVDGTLSIAVVVDF
jgi:putative salt-induced outer membrane protein YdiY